MNAINYHYLSVGKAEFNAYYFDGNYYLILSMKDEDEYRLTGNTVVKFKLSDGSVIRLVGSSDKHYAIFYISPEDVERLVEGVDKVIINTIPEMYFKSDWSGREKFGITLYEELKKMRAEYCEFDESDEIVK
jgi:hypothetical protein